MTADVTVEVRFKTSAEGGRATAVGDSPVVDYYSCPFIVDGEAFDCRLFLGHRRLELGKVYEVPIKFINPQSVLPKLITGKEFVLWEGKVVATGKVLRIP